MLRFTDSILDFEIDLVANNMGLQCLTDLGLSFHFHRGFVHNYFGHSFEIVNVVSLDLGLLVSL